ncbi:MAG TPA: hypothetical protein VFJ70_08990 [Burkholderiales bacterium]|nr:hypothetical protein [Burkholderiales bacterium]
MAELAGAMFGFLLGGFVWTRFLYWIGCLWWPSKTGARRWLIRTSGATSDGSFSGTSGSSVVS